MPGPNNKKRKSDKDVKASPSKKTKLSGKQSKKSAASTSKKTTPSKVQASKLKKVSQKSTKSPQKAKASEKSTRKAVPAKSKVQSKQSKKKETTKKTDKSTAVKKNDKAAKSTVTRGKLSTAVKSKTQSAASKAKEKALKLQKLKKPDIKKPKVVPSQQKLEKPKKQVVSQKVEKKDKSKPNPKDRVAENPAKKRKATEEEENDESPRKRRIITPNKKYADFEVGMSPRVSELRAFLQDKRKSTPDDSPTKRALVSEKPSPKPSAAKKSPAVKEKDGKDDEDIKVIKTSEMKPAEKLLKKLQKKLEKEARAASVFKPKEDKDKTKITKVVTYNKPKTKISSLPIKSLAQSPKLPRIPKNPITTSKSASKETPKNKEKKVAKVIPRVQPTPEKIVKPKKIKEMKREERSIQVKLAHQKNIKQKDDQKCWVTGIDTFPSGEVIMVDMANKKIKLFNKTLDECLSHVKLDTIPQDISVSPVDASSAYFTKPFSKEGIQKISMSDGKLTLKESFFTNGTNRGIKCTKSGILTSVQDGRYHDLDINCFKIDFLDYEGKSLKTVSVDQTGTRLFKLPLYFTTSNNDKQIIVSDCIRQNSYIVNLDLTGKIKFKYTGLLAPRGLTVDNNDNVFVTEWEQNNIYVLSPTGKRLQVLITDQECQDEGLDGLLKPYQLCFVPNEAHGQLIVSQEGSNTVKVFDISKLEKSDTEGSPKKEKAEPENSPKKQVAVNENEEKSTG